MYRISEVAKQTGFTEHTLRYYEKIGLFSSSARQSGRRLYTEGDVRLLQFMKRLKNTGMSLENIQQFLVDGCILENNDLTAEKGKKIVKRMEILQRHLLSLELQREEIDQVISLTKEKLAFYEEMVIGGQNEK